MMDDVTQQNAALVEQASAAALALTEHARNLTQLIAGYRVGDNAAQDHRARSCVRHRYALPLRSLSRSLFLSRSRHGTPCADPPHDR